MNKRILSIVLACIMLVSLLTGCNTATSPESEQATQSSQSEQTDNEKPSISEQEDSEAVTQEIQLQWSATNFHSFDNNKNYAAEEIQVQSQVLEGLTRAFVDADGNQVLEPAGAESWDVSDDGLTWTFHLREYYWSDGVQVTAQHFVDSYHRIGDPRNAFDFAVFLDDIVGGHGALLYGCRDCYGC